MNTEQRKETIRQAVKGITEGNPGPMLNMMDDGVQWTTIGNTRFSGLYDGKQELIERLFGALGEYIDGQLHITLDNMFGEGEFIAVQGRGESKTKAGGTYNNTYCWIYTWSGDKVVAVTEYLDTELVTASFGR